MATIKDNPFTVAPFTIVVDTDEKAPFTFNQIPAREEDGGGMVIVPKIRRKLPTADYAIDGWEHRVVVERKSLTDLYGTLGRGRKRFEREFERMAELEYAAVVVEAGWEEIVDPEGNDPLWYSKLGPRSVVATVFAWSQRYPHIDWFPMGSRWLAEFATYEILERFWRDRQ